MADTLSAPRQNKLEMLISRIRCTDRTRQVLRIAIEEAASLKTRMLQPVHILIALAIEKGGAHAAFLGQQNVTADTIRKGVRAGGHGVQPNEVDLAEVTRVLLDECLPNEMNRLAHEIIGTEHLLLALTVFENAHFKSLCQQAGIDLQKIHDELCSNFPAPSKNVTDLTVADAVWQTIFSFRLPDGDVCSPEDLAKGIAPLINQLRAGGKRIVAVQLVSE